MLASSDVVVVPLKSFHIFKDDNFTPRLRIDTYSSSTPECYHAGARATVPFLWESQPGTPKHSLRNTPLPPLTPPPSSFFSNSATTPPPKNLSTSLQTSKFGFPRLSFIRSHHHNAVRMSPSSETSPHSSSSSSSPSVLSSPATPLCDYYYSRRYGFKFESEEDKEHFRSSSYSCSPFRCYGSEKCNRRNIARKAGGRCSSMFKRLIGSPTP